LETGDGRSAMNLSRYLAGRPAAAVLIIWLLAQVVVSAPSASAHAFLASSDPAANAVLATAPSTVTLRFTEPLETSYSRAELYDQSGASVAGATSTIGSDGQSMTVSLPSGLKNGTYSLLWRTLSAADGHTAQGYLPFTIGTQDDVRIVSPPVVANPLGALPDRAEAVSRWLALLGLAALVAIWPVWLFVVRPAIAPTWQLGPNITRRVRAFATGAFIFAVIANVLALAVQAISIAGTSNPLAALTTTLADTRYGTWWLVRVGVLLLFAASLLGAAWWWPWRRRNVTLLLLVASAILPLPFSMISHASAEGAGQATAIAFDYAHLLGASLWSGGVLLLLVSLGPTLGRLTAAGRRVVLGRAIPRFSLLALCAWAVILLTGLYASWLQVGNLNALTNTPYGQTLILKLILIAPLLALGAFNLTVVTRKLRAATTEERVDGWSNHFITAVAAEAIVVTLLLGVVGMLVGTPPGRQVLEQEAGSLRIPLTSGNQTGTLYITPGTVGQNHYRLELGSGHEAHLGAAVVTEANLRLELPDRQTGQVDVRLVSAPSGGYEAHGSELAFPGNWQFQVTVRAPGEADWVATATDPIGAEPPPSDVPPPPPLFGPSGIAALLLLVLGEIGIIFGLASGKPIFRKEAAGLGAVAIAAGLLLLLQARIPPDAVAAVNPATASLGALDPVAVAKGQTLFVQNCASCHGAGARGDGPAAASLRRPPADLTTGHAIPHSDDDYLYWITNGIAGTDMPAFGGKLDEGSIRDVITYVRSLQQTALLARDAPGPEQCTVQPRTLDEIKALAEGPDPQQPPNATESGGQPVDDATRNEIVATARELVACSNAGDILRRLALYSDQRLHFAYPDGPTRALEAIAKTPLPLQLSERVALISVDDVRQLDDGRVVAEVTIDNPASHTHDPNAVATPSPRETARLIFVNQAGRWRVDETRREGV
jgi:copper transport protein